MPIQRKISMYVFSFETAPLVGDLDRNLLLHMLYWLEDLPDMFMFYIEFLNNISLSLLT